MSQSRNGKSVHPHFYRQRLQVPDLERKGQKNLEDLSTESQTVVQTSVLKPVTRAYLSLLRVHLVGDSQRGDGDHPLTVLVISMAVIEAVNSLVDLTVEVPMVYHILLSQGVVFQARVVSVALSKFKIRMPCKRRIN